MSNFELNPCNACINTYGIEDINNINQCCSDTYSAFAGIDSINNVKDSESFKNCKECVQKSIKSLGRDKCNFRITDYPSWIQSQHYFPKLFYKTNDIEYAKDECKKMCDEGGYMPQQCKQNCEIDSMTVVQNTKENFLENTSSITPTNSPTPYKSNHNRKKNNKLEFFLSFVLSSIIFAIIIVLFLKIMMKK